jgi:hypothetical protein
MKAKIQSSRTLFKLSKLDPHYFIDDIPNLLLVIQLKNGWIIGGFSS